MVSRKRHSYTLASDVQPFDTLHQALGRGRLSQEGGREIVALQRALGLGTARDQSHAA